MIAFEKGEYDVLLSTSIVESGIHKPSANTMIVDGANSFGIADLHQLRGILLFYGRRQRATK